MNKIYVVGLGPGAADQITPKAMDALKQSDVIAGYTVYVDLIRDQFSDKEFITTPMKKESERCKLAIEEALKDRTVAMVCSGDAGVYGMAGLMYEMAEVMNVVNRLQIVIISGLSAMELSLDYDYHAVVIAYIFYIFYDKPLTRAGLGYLSIIKELYSFLGFGLTLTYNGKRGKQYKWINYLFYPVHIFILGILRFYLNI